MIIKVETKQLFYWRRLPESYIYLYPLSLESSIRYLNKKKLYKTEIIKIIISIRNAHSRQEKYRAKLFQFNIDIDPRVSVHGSLYSLKNLLFHVKTCTGNQTRYISADYTTVERLR